MNEQNNILSDALGEQIPEEVQKTLNNLQSLKGLYAQGLLLLSEKEKQSQISSDEKQIKAAFFNVSLTETENISDNLKKHVSDPDIIKICSELNSHFRIYQNKTGEYSRDDLNRLEADLQLIGNKVAELKNRLEQLDTEKPSFAHPLDRRANRKEYYEKQAELDQTEAQLNQLKEQQDKGNKTPIEQTYPAIEKEATNLNKNLVAKEKQRIAEIAFAGQEDAEAQASIHVLRQYNEFVQSILSLPKERRDSDLTLLHNTVLAYKNIISPEFKKNIVDQIASEGKKVLENQKAEFAGVRGFFQKMIKKGTELGVSGLSYLMGDPNSLLLKMGKAGAELTNEFLSPVQYNEALIKKVQDETLAEIDSVLALMKGNENIINALEDGIIDVKSTQSDYLKDEAKKAFLAKYEPFVKLTLQFNSNLIQKQSEFLTTAYTQSQGKENSMFPPDSEGAAKFMDPGQIAKLIKSAKDGFSSGEKVDQDALDKILNYIEENAGGRNYWRLFQVYSPFGIACPDEVDVKEVPGRTFNPKSVHIQSAYEQGWFKDHPVASALIQTSEFPAGYLLGKVGIWATKKLAKKLTLTGRIASSLSRYLPEMPKLLTWKTVLPIAIFGSLMLQPSGEEGKSGVPVTLKQNEILDRIKQKASKYLPLEEKGEIDKAKLIEIPPFDELCAEEIKELRNEILFTALTTTEGVQKDLGYENLFWDHYTFYLRDALTDDKDPRNDYFRKQLQSTSTPNIINAYRKANKRLLFLGLDLIPYPEK